MQDENFKKNNAKQGVVHYAIEQHRFDKKRKSMFDKKIDRHYFEWVYNLFEFPALNLKDLKQYASFLKKLHSQLDKSIEQKRSSLVQDNKESFLCRVQKVIFKKITR